MLDLSEQKAVLARRGICVIIPTYNNGSTIADVVSRALAQCTDVFVVCDGCTDGTLDILEKLEQKPVLISYSKNRGKGAALMAGFKTALEKGFSYAITIDGDGQHFPEDIPLFLEENRRSPGEIIIGSRSGLDSVSRSTGSRFANRFSNLWFYLQTAKRLEDTQSGYRLYPLKKLPCRCLLTSRYEAELELLVLSAWKGVGISSVSVRVHYPAPEERVSHFRPVADFARISVLNTVLCILALCYGFPRMLIRGILAVLKTLSVALIFGFSTIFIFTPLAFIYLKAGGRSERKKDNLHKAIAGIARTAMRLLPGVTFSTGNVREEDFSKPAIIICNHSSHLDLLPILAMTDRLVILTTDWVWNDIFYGYIIRNAEFLPASDGIDTLLPQMESLIRRGFSIVIFPEGTRSADCTVGRFHQGAFKVAKELGVDILHLVLYGTGKALPKHGRILRQWPVLLEMGARTSVQQIQSEGKTPMEMSSESRSICTERYAKIADEMERNV